MADRKEWKLTAAQAAMNHAAARTLLGALADEYVRAAEQGKLWAWREAVNAVAELLAPKGKEPSDD